STRLHADFIVPVMQGVSTAFVSISLQLVVIDAIPASDGSQVISV
ncbi:MFS transporter, partial [Staphylococcus pseudintermedius]